MEKILFKDYVAIRSVSVPKEYRTDFIDKIIRKMEDEPEESGTVKGLQVRINATHAARLTGHYHYYSPAKMRKGADTFVTPYEKPVLAHHNDKEDAIGRVTSSVYIPTPSPVVPVSLIEIADKDMVHTSKSLTYTKKLWPYLKDRRFEGLGYLSLIGNIPDPTAIEKVIDGRYHTVSVGYGTDSLHCSHCLQNWVTDGPCEHEKGHIYDGMPMFLIFGNLWYDEVSYVNRPADELAKTEEMRKVSINVASLKDSISRIKSKSKIQSLVTSAVAMDSMAISGIDRVPIEEQGIYYLDKDTNDYISIYNNLNSLNNGESMITVKDLLALDNKELYAKIAEHLDEGQAISVEELEKLEDGVFVGPQRNFPAHNIDYIKACKALIESMEDSEEKTEYLEFLDTREIALQAPAVEETDENQNETTDNTDNQPENTEPAVESQDTIQYQFVLGASGWGLPEGTEPDAEIEKQILELMLKAYSTKKEDALSYINLILDTIGEEKTEVVNTLSQDKVDRISELESQLATQKQEYAILSASHKAINKVAADYAGKIKEFYIDSLLAAKDSHDPKKSIEDERKLLESKSLDELKSAYEVLGILKDKNSKTPQSLQDTSHKFDAIVSEEQIQQMEDSIEKTYLTIKKTQGTTIANNYKAYQMSIVDAAKKNLANLKNTE